MTRIVLAMGRFILSLLVGTVLAAAGGAQATTIKKCQDASGKWHYGDYAAQECAASRITEMDQRGLKVKEHEVPPTKEEIEAQKQSKLRQRQEQQRAAEQRRAENLLLNTYDSEQSIERTRDQKLAAIDKAVKHDEYYLAKLQTNLNKLEKGQVKKKNKKNGAKDSADNTRQQIDALREQVLDYERAIESRMRERDRIMTLYNQQLDRYREILKRRRAEVATQ